MPDRMLLDRFCPTINLIFAFEGAFKLLKGGHYRPLNLSFSSSSIYSPIPQRYYNLLATQMHITGYYTAILDKNNLSCILYERSKTTPRSYIRMQRGVNCQQQHWGRWLWWCRQRNYCSVKFFKTKKVYWKKFILF